MDLLARGSGASGSRGFKERETREGRKAGVQGERWERERTQVKRLRGGMEEAWLRWWPRERLVDLVGVQWKDTRMMGRKGDRGKEKLIWEEGRQCQRKTGQGKDTEQGSIPLRISATLGTSWEKTLPSSHTYIGTPSQKQLTG